MYIRVRIFEFGKIEHEQNYDNPFHKMQQEILKQMLYIKNILVDYIDMLCIG